MQDKHSEVKFWDAVADERVYSAFDPSEYQWVIDKLLCDEKNLGKVLDVGCASGISAVMFSQHSSRVVGLDISPELIRQATRLNPVQNIVVFEVGDAECLTAGDSTFDIVFYGGVIHHLVDRSALISEAFRVLRPGGRIVAMEPNALDFFERIEWKVARLRGKLSPNEEPIDPLLFSQELFQQGFSSVKFEVFRSDIPVLNQIPVLKRFFSRSRGMPLKKSVLRVVNVFRKNESQGNFFLISAQK